MTNQRLALAFFLFISSSLALKLVTLKQLETYISKTELVVIVFQSSINEQMKELSKRVVEEMDRVAAALTQDGNTRIRFFGVSLDQHPEAMSEYELNDVPAIVVFRDKYPRLYYGQRVAFTMFNFFQELMQIDPIKIIENKQEKKQFTSDDHSVKVVGYFSKEGEGLDAFKLAAKHFQGELSFGLVQDPKLAKTFKIKSEGEIAIIKPGERPTHTTTPLTSRDELVPWILENKKPLWGLLTFQNIYNVWQGVKITFVVFLKNMEEHYTKTVLSVFKTLAKQYGPSHDIVFVIVDAGVYKEFAQGVGLADEDLPTFAIFNPMKRKEHFFPKDRLQLNINNAKRWLDSFLAGKLESPSDKELYTEEDAVVQVKADNFEEIVYDKEKDVLLEFYAPWCGYCAALAPQYKAIAMQFSLFPSIVLGAFDTQASPVPDKFNITALPTLLFFPANDKENPISFSAVARDRAGILQFIVEHQTTLDANAVESFKLLGKIEEGFKEEELQPVDGETIEDNEENE